MVSEGCFSLPGRVALAILLFTVWMMATPYYGIRHDAVLYSVQALLQLKPEAFGHDLFFRFGSQERFTLFPYLHAWVIHVVGFDAAALGLTLLGKMLWFLGLLWFASSFQRGAGKWLGLALVVGISPYFDQWRMLSYGESFVTARLFSEALVLVALGFVIRQRSLPGFAALALALSLHPLVALPGCGAAMLLIRWKSASSPMAVTLGLAAVGLLLAVMGVEPFDKLLLSYDSEWLTVVEYRNPIVFPDIPDAYFGGRLVFLAAALLAARGTHVPGLVRLANAMLLLGIGMLLVSFLGATQFHNVLITQLQLWRVLWLVQLVTLVLLGSTLVELWRAGDVQRLLALVLASAVLLDGLSAGLLAVFGLAGTYLTSRYLPDWKPNRAIWTVATVVLILSLAAYALEAPVGKVRGEPLGRLGWLIATANVILAVCLTFAILHISARSRSWGMRMGILLGGISFLGATLVWYDGAKTAWGRESQVGVASSKEIQRRIPESATVYWPGRLNYTWFWLQRSFYASSNQTAGALFSRATALEAARRQQRLYALDLEDGNPYWVWNRRVRSPASAFPPRRTGQEMVATLCQDPVLDFLIMPDGITVASILTFSDPAFPTRWVLIDCASQRAEASEADVSGMAK